MSKLQIVPYSENLAERVIQLHSAAFGVQTDECRSYLTWKYLRNPYLREPTAFVALDDRGRAVGLRGFYGTLWQGSGWESIIPCADDFAIAEEHRGSGLATAIMRLALDELRSRGFGYVLNASGGQTTVLQQLAMGWKSLGQMKPIEKVNARERMLRDLEARARKRRVLWRLVNTRGYLKANLRSFARLDRPGEFHTEDGMAIAVTTRPRSRAMAELANRLPRDGRVRHVRDEAFFSWRYDNPARHYRFLYGERNGVLQGYLVLGMVNSTFESPMVPVLLVDLETSSDRVAAGLLDYALARARPPSVSAWEASLSPPIRGMLQLRGFVPALTELRARGLPCVLLKRLGDPPDGCPNLLESAWDIRLADSMRG